MLSCIIIDDEQDSIDGLNEIIKEFCPNVYILSTANSVEDGILEIETKRPDLVFLDIELQDGTGFDILEKTRHRNFEVIFIIKVSICNMIHIS